MAAIYADLSGEGPGPVYMHHIVGKYIRARLPIRVLASVSRSHRDRSWRRIR